MRIVLLNDNRLFATALYKRVEQDPRFEIVGLASDGTEAARLVDEVRPDVVLIDAGVPGNDPLVATRLIMRGDATPRVVIMADPDDELDAVEAHDAGASAFLQKPRSVADLLETLELAAILAQVRVARADADKP
ncbi:MAG TPA: response regulator [Gaiellaceae bacterium]|nr:response regulator [Gaiellaceae bacterium]